MAAAAIEAAIKAAEYAEEIQNTATKLGITTKALQEYGFVAIASGVSTDTLRESIQKGNAAIGALQSGVGGERMKKAFEGLKISPDEAKGWNNILDALPTISDRINNLGTVAEKTQIAKRLGIEGILPIIMKGKEGIDELRNAAESSGAVLDTDVIAKGKEAAEKMKEASQEVDINLKRAFIGLAPFIAACVELIGKMAKGIADAIEAFGPIENWSRVHINDQMADERRTQAMLRPMAGNVDKNGRATGGLFSFAWNNHQNNLDQMSQRLGALDKIDANAAKGAHGTAGAPLVADKKSKADHTGEDSKEALEAADEAAKELAQARAALTGDVLKHAELEKQAIDEETKKKNDALAAATAKIEADKTLTAAKREQLKVENALTAAANQIAGSLKKQLIDQKAKEDADKIWLTAQEAINADYKQIAQISASLAHAASDRRRILRKDQSADQKLDYAKLSNSLGWDVVGGRISQSSMDSQLGARKDLYAAQNKQLDHNTMSPWEDWASKGLQSSSEVGEALQKEAVKGIDDFNRGLAESIVNGKSFGQEFRSILKQIEADIIQLLLKQSEIGIFGGGTAGAGGSPAGGGIIGGIASAIFGGAFHFADGGPVPGSGGGDTVPAFLTPGEFVLSKGMLNSLGSLSAKAMNVSHVSSIQQHFHVDARGSLGFDEYTSQQDAKMQAHAQIAAVAGAKGGHQMTMTKLASQSRNRLR